MAIEGLDEAFSNKVEATAPEPVVEEIVQEPAVEEVAPEPEPVVEPVIEAPKQDHSVPLPKYLDTRDELKEARRRIAELEANTAPQPQRPDPFDDPDGFAQHIESRVAQAEMQAVWQVSDRLARKEHGSEVVDAAIQWATERAPNDLGFTTSYMKAEDPIDWIVRQHKQHAIVSQLPTDVSSLDELIEREIAKRGLVAPTVAAPVMEAAVTQQALKPAPPRSIASDAPAPTKVVNPMEEFNAIFK